MSIRLVSVSHRFGSHRALEEVSIHLRSGDCYGLVGHNGAGKTTAMRIALGLVRPQAGRVLIDGFDAARYPREARTLTGAMIEQPAFPKGVNGRANLVALARLQGMTRRAAGVEADRLLELVGLGPQARKRFGAYSQGMRQRLGLAQALIGNPPYLFLDEPMNGLDPEGVAEVRALLQRLVREEGRTVLLSSHLLQELAELCNRIGVLRQGRVLVEETKDALLADDGRRYDVRTNDDRAAADLLRSRGLAVTVEGDGQPRVDLGTRDPGDVARMLVEANLSLRVFAPRSPDLEEIYLRWTNTRAPAGTAGTAATADGKTDPPNASAKPTRSAPPRPIMRVLGHELRQRQRRIALLALPAVAAAWSVRGRHVEAEATAREAAEAGFFSSTSVTAFESVGWALNAALPLLGLLVAGIASQLIAHERAEGTLRHLLLRPIRRGQLAAGKAAAGLLMTLAAYGAVAAAAVVASTIVFDFEDLTELLLTGDAMPVETATAELMWPRLWRVLAAPVLPLCAYAGLGFLAGAVVRRGAVALATALAAVVLLTMSRTMAAGYGFEAWIPATHLPSLLGDSTSYIRYFIDASQGASDAQYRYGLIAVAAPTSWCAGALLLAGVVTAMRTEQ